MANPNATDNLPKDENGNVKGGPGMPSFRDMIFKVGAEEVEHEGRKVTRIEKSIIGAFKLATSDDANQSVPALKFLAQHSEGTKSDDKREVTLNVTIIDETIPPKTDNQSLENTL